MDTDFINLYIEQLTKTLHDLTSKNVVLETKLALSSKVIESLSIQIEEQRKDLEDKGQHINKLAEAIEELNAEIVTSRNALDAAEKALNTNTASNIRQKTTQN